MRLINVFEYLNLFLHHFENEKKRGFEKKHWLFLLRHMQSFYVKGFRTPLRGKIDPRRRVANISSRSFSLRV